MLETIGAHSSTQTREEGHLSLLPTLTGISSELSQLEVKIGRKFADLGVSNYHPITDSEPFLATQDIYPGLLIHADSWALVEYLQVNPDSCSGKGAFSIDESLYQAGHFPKNPRLPGVLILEGMNQIGAALILSIIRKDEEQPTGKLVLFNGCKNFSLKGQPDLNGQSITAHAVWLPVKSAVQEVAVIASFNNEVIATGIIQGVMCTEERGLCRIRHPHFKTLKSVP